MTRTTPRFLAVLLALLVLAGACGRGDKNDDGGKAATTTSSTTTGSGSGTGTTGDGSATTAAGGSSGATTTVAGNGATTTAVPNGGESEGVIELTITGGNVEGGVRRAKVKQGSQVTLRVTSDVSDEIHVHGYDLKLDLTAGQSSDLTFLAKIPGVFEVELEQRGKKVLELEVGA
jgi:hypothetical protein